MRSAFNSFAHRPSSLFNVVLLLLVISILSTIARAEYPAYSSASALDYDEGLFGTIPTQNLSSTTNFNNTHLLRRVWNPERCDRPGHYYFIAPHGFQVGHNGPEIIDQDGRTIWFGQGFNNSYGFRPQLYKGEWHLTWWTGGEFQGHGEGRYYIMNDKYRIIKNFTAVGDTLGDVHEIELTPNSTAIITVYRRTAWDLTAFGIEENKGFIYDCIFQEIDLDTGDLVFSWQASDHVPLAENTHGRTKSHGRADRPWDCFHLNSIEKDVFGNYLVSIRHMSTIYYVSGESGDILWRLGGKNNDFEDLTPDNITTNYWGQHHARWHDNMRTMTVYDNSKKTDPFGSRALKLAIDTQKMTVDLLAQAIHPQHHYSATRGSVQVYDDGTLLVGYGSVPVFSEYSPDGQELLCDWQFGATHAGPFGTLTSKGVASYRVHRMPWKGYPTENPDVVFEAQKNLMHASWNGATEVRQWVLEGMRKSGGTSRFGFGGDWEDIAVFWKVGFENSLSVDVAKYSAFRLAALDEDGEQLGRWLYNPQGEGQVLSNFLPSTLSSSLSTTTATTTTTTTTTILALLFCLSLLLTLLLRHYRTRSNEKSNHGYTLLPRWARPQRKTPLFVEAEVYGEGSEEMGLVGDGGPGGKQEGKGEDGGALAGVRREKEIQGRARSSSFEWAEGEDAARRKEGG